MSLRNLCFFDDALKIFLSIKDEGSNFTEHIYTSIISCFYDLKNYEECYEYIKKSEFNNPVIVKYKEKIEMALKNKN
jgi:hypothetical protein